MSTPLAGEQPHTAWATKRPQDFGKQENQPHRAPSTGKHGSDCGPGRNLVKRHEQQRRPDRTPLDQVKSLHAMPPPGLATGRRMSGNSSTDQVGILQKARNSCTCRPDRITTRNAVAAAPTTPPSPLFDQVEALQGSGKQQDRPDCTTPYAAARQPSGRKTSREQKHRPRRNPSTGKHSSVESLQEGGACVTAPPPRPASGRTTSVSGSIDQVRPFHQKAAAFVDHVKILPTRRSSHTDQLEPRPTKADPGRQQRQQHMPSCITLTLPL